MSHRSLALAACLVAAALLGAVGCDFDGKTCTMEARTTTAHITVVDRATKAPICDATVSITMEGGSAQQATRVAATSDAPCGYRGGSFREGSSGKTVTYYVEKDGYQDALATGQVPSSADECHVGTPAQTIELNK